MRMSDTGKWKLPKPVPKLDVHAHLSPEGNGQTCFGIRDRLEFDRFMGIGHAVILPYPVRDGRRAADGEVMDTDQARKAAEEEPEHFSWFCSVYPEGTRRVREQLAEYQAQGAVGVGELGYMLPFDDPGMDHLLTCCGALGLPVLFHISPMGHGPYGVIDAPGLPGLEKALATHPDTVMIAHSQPFWYELSTYDRAIPVQQLNGFPSGPVEEEGRAVELLRKYPNLYADLSANSGSNGILRDPEYGIRFLNEFQDRLLFGSDQLGTGRIAPLGQMLDYYLLLGKISQEVYDKICRRNGEKLLKLSLSLG